MKVEQLSGFGWHIGNMGSACSSSGIRVRTQRLLREAIGRTDGAMPAAARVAMATAAVMVAVVSADVLGAVNQARPQSIAMASR